MIFGEHAGLERSRKGLRQRRGGFREVRRGKARNEIAVNVEHEARYCTRYALLRSEYISDSGYLGGRTLFYSLLQRL